MSEPFLEKVDVFLPGQGETLTHSFIPLTSILFLSAELLTPYHICTLPYLCSLSPPFGFAWLFRRLRKLCPHLGEYGQRSLPVL